MIKYILILIILFIFVNIYFNKIEKIEHLNYFSTCFNNNNIKLSSNIDQKKIKMLSIIEKPPDNYSTKEINYDNCKDITSIGYAKLMNCSDNNHVKVNSMIKGYNSNYVWNGKYNNKYLYYAPSGCSLLLNADNSNDDVHLGYNKYYNRYPVYNKEDYIVEFDCLDRNKTELCKNWNKDMYGYSDWDKNLCIKYLKYHKFFENKIFNKFFTKLKISYILFFIYRRVIYDRRVPKLMELKKLEIQFSDLFNNYNKLNQKKSDEINKINKDFYNDYYNFIELNKKLIKNDKFNKLYEDLKNKLNNYINNAKTLYKNSNNNVEFKYNESAQKEEYIFNTTTHFNLIINVEFLDKNLSSINTTRSSLDYEKTKAAYEKLNNIDRNKLNYYNMFSFIDDDLNNILDIYNLNTLKNYPDIESVVNFMKNKDKEKYSDIINNIDEKLKLYKGNDKLFYLYKKHGFTINKDGTGYDNEDFMKDNELDFLDNVFVDYSDKLKFLHTDKFSSDTYTQMIYSIKNYNLFRLKKMYDDFFKTEEELYPYKLFLQNTVNYNDSLDNVKISHNDTILTY